MLTLHFVADLPVFVSWDFFFFLNDTAPTETSPLPLHDALPIWQRVAVGRAIAPQPAVFLFDEPLSNLDAKLRVQTRAEITKLQSTLGTTSVYVTHDQVEAMTMGHRITVMREGKIQQVGTPREVYESPANAFVAQFIGTPPMNLIAATVSGETLQTSSFT